MNTATLGASVGALLIASWFSTALSGILLLQAYFYFRKRPSHDQRFVSPLVSIIVTIKITFAITAVIYQVVVLWQVSSLCSQRWSFLAQCAFSVLDLAHVACIMATLYHYLIRRFGNDEALKLLTP